MRCGYLSIIIYVNIALSLNIFIFILILLIINYPFSHHFLLIRPCPSSGGEYQCQMARQR
jgi:hypothetical protein